LVIDSIPPATTTDPLRRSLSLSGGQNTAHQHLVHIFRRDPGAFDRGTNGACAKLCACRI